MSVAACGTPGAARRPGRPRHGGGTATRPAARVKVGLVYSKSGPLATYGEQYRQGFTAGLDYATKGTGAVDGHKIEITEQDDAGDPAKAVASATDLIGQGNKIIAGSTSSGVALQVAPLPQDNKVLFISGPAAADAVTGANKYTFRSGRQTYQDVATAGSMLGDVKGKKVTVLAQDSAFGKANVAAVTAVLGAKGATVDSVEVPAAATDLTPFATKVKAAAPDLLFVAWAGSQRHRDVDDPGAAGRLRLDQGRHRPRHQADPRALRRGRRRDRLPLALLRRRGRQRRLQGARRRAEEAGRHGRPVHQRRLRRGAR